MRARRRRGRPKSKTNAVLKRARCYNDVALSLSQRTVLTTLSRNNISMEYLVFQIYVLSRRVYSAETPAYRVHEYLLRTVPKFKLDAKNHWTIDNNYYLVFFIVFIDIRQERTSVYSMLR